jgi:hypothetical protein
MLYIQDDRYKTTTLEVVLAPADEAAGELARMCLDSSPHYLAIEVWDDQRLVIRLAKEGQFPAPLTKPGQGAAQEDGE